MSVFRKILNDSFMCKVLDHLNYKILFYLQMRGLAREHLIDIVAKFEPCPENLQRMVLGIDGTRNLFLTSDLIMHTENDCLHQ